MPELHVDVLGFAEIGGFGEMIYHTVKFPEYVLAKLLFQNENPNEEDFPKDYSDEFNQYPSVPSANAAELIVATSNQKRQRKD